MYGCEWVIEAHGCDAAALADLAKLRALFTKLTEALFLHPVGDATFHQFPGTVALRACVYSRNRTLPAILSEYHSLCLNIFCCRPRAEWILARI